MKIDVVCPLYKSEPYIETLIKNLQAQNGIEYGVVVFPITKSGNDDFVIDKLSKAGYQYFFVEEGKFSHSLTREKAIYDYCKNDIVLMISQDVTLLQPNSVCELVQNVNDDVVYVYGRQVCRKKTIEYYVRQKNYGSETLIISAAEIEKMQLSAFFASDAFAAYHRPTFIKINGYDHIGMMMSEDMYYSKKILENGYKKAYIATAVVEHSHKFTLKQLYTRYFETGRWFRAHPEFDNYKTIDSGMQLAKHVLKCAVREFNLPVLFRFLPDMAARYLGMKKGKKHE